jgi:hypothetical protein
MLLAIILLTLQKYKNEYTLSARHVARGTLKAEIHYQDPDELDQLIDGAADLMERTLESGRTIADAIFNVVYAAPLAKSRHLHGQQAFGVRA